MMLLQIYFEVPETHQAHFERLYKEVYIPALQVQPGYIRSNLLRVFPPGVAQEIDAEPTSYNYQLELVFDTEENRRRWVASDEHTAAWPQAAALAINIIHRGYDLVAQDNHNVERV